VADVEADEKFVYYQDTVLLNYRKIKKENPRGG
jgi:hypothetical protein